MEDTAEAGRALPLGDTFQRLEQSRLRHRLALLETAEPGEAASAGDSSLPALPGAVVRSGWQFQLKRDYRFLLTSLLPLGIRFCRVLRVRTPQDCSERCRTSAGADPASSTQAALELCHGEGAPWQRSGRIPIPAGQAEMLLRASRTWSTVPRAVGPRLSAVPCHRHAVPPPHHPAVLLGTSQSRFAHCWRRFQP